MALVLGLLLLFFFSFLLRPLSLSEVSNGDDPSADVKGLISDMSTANIASTKAAVENNAAKVESISSDISSLASQIASSDPELTAVIAVREKETKDFSTSKAELMEVVDTLQRAISILQKKIDIHTYTTRTVIVESPAEEKKTRKGSQEEQVCLRKQSCEEQSRRDQRIQSRRSSCRSEVHV